LLVEAPAFRPCAGIAVGPEHDQWPITTTGRRGGRNYVCAANALFSCPAIISQRPESRIISNEPLENTEEESKII